MRRPRLGRALLIVAASLAATTVPSAALQGSPEERGAAATLDRLEAILGWTPPDASIATDVRVMTRSALAVAPLPLIRLTGGEDNHITATVTEWGAVHAAPGDGQPLFFKYLPLTCVEDRALCAGTPREVRTPQVKAMWFALFIARSCNDHPRTSLSDAEDLYVRGRVGGVPMAFSCQGPNPRGASPGDRQAAAVLRMARRLVAR